MMKKKALRFPLLLLAAFLFGAVGHILFRPLPAEEKSYTLMLRTEDIPALLSYALPAVGDPLSLDGVSATVISLETQAPVREFRKEGQLLSLPSRLFCTHILTIRIQAHEKEGRLYLGDRMLLRGDAVCISGQNFAISAILWDFNAVF